MGFYKILKTLKYIFLKNKRKLIIIFIFLFINILVILKDTGVFAVDYNETPTLSQITDLIDLINTQISTNTQYDLTQNNTIAFYFADDYAQCYRVIFTQSHSDYDGNFNIYQYPYPDTNANFNVADTQPVAIWNNGTNILALINVSYNGQVSFVTGTRGSGLLNNIFNLPNTLNTYNLLYVSCSSQDSTDIYNKIKYDWLDFYKVSPQLPFIQYNGSSYDIDGKLVLKLGNTLLPTDVIVNSLFEIYEVNNNEDDFETLKASYNLSGISANYDSELEAYTFNLNTLDSLLTQGVDYSFYITLYSENKFYIKDEVMQVNWNSEHIDGSIIINPDNPDNPTNPDYTQNLDDINSGITDINSSINNDNVDDMTSTFSGLSDGFSVNDPTGLDSVFAKLYNAFCTDNVINLTFTIPFVNKQVTISSANVSNYFPQALKSIVSVFVWGMIGLWVLKDIRSMIDRMSEGSPEDVGSDVKKEVL